MAIRHDQRSGVGTLQFLAVIVFLAGLVVVAEGLGALNDTEGAVTSDKWTYVAIAGTPALVGSGLLYGLSRVVDLLYDLRDDRREPVRTPEDQGPVM